MERLMDLPLSKKELHEITVNKKKSIH